MKQTKLIMGMPVVIEVVDPGIAKKDIQEVFDHFKYVDATFSTYKRTSEISLINFGKVAKKDYSSDMKTIFRLAQKTKRETNGYFDIFFKGRYDPSGIVKGWAIFNAAKILWRKGYNNFYVDAGGDIQVSGKNMEGKDWLVGIRNPFNRHENVKVLSLSNLGVATSGTAIRGQHITNPKDPAKKFLDIVSLTVIGSNVYEADRMATAAFAMEKEGILFLEKLPKFEGYMIDREGTATYTSGFNNYVYKNT